jgi:hemolysin activation/secretion protein
VIQTEAATIIKQAKEATTADHSNPSDTDIPTISVTPPNFTITGYAVDGNTLLADKDVIQTLSPFIGDDKSFADVQKAIDALQKRYSEQGYHAVRVTLPEQNINSGNIHILIIEGMITAIRVEGATKHDEKNILKTLPSIRVGSSPKLNDITADLKIANENPAKNTSVLMRNAGKTGELEAVIKVKDVDPQTFSATLDNTGTPQTGEGRVTAAYQHANLSNHDDVLRLQIGSSTQYPERYKTIMGAYHVPVFTTNASVDLYAAVSDANSGMLAGSAMQITGAGQVIGARYNQLLASSGAYTHGAFIGIEQKQFRTNFTINDTTIDGAAIGSPNIDALPITLGYKGNWQGKNSQTAWYAAYSHNLAGSDDHSSYQTVGSTQNYRLWRYGADYMTSLDMDWRLRLRLTGQKANDHLIAGEQFAIGGNDNLRGLYERSMAADNAHLLTAEVYTPDMGDKISNALSLRGLIFIDRLSAQNEGASNTTSDLSSAGIGVRLGYQKNISMRADLARLMDVPDGLAQKSGDLYAHVGMTISH